MTQFHFEPDSYLEFVRAEVPAYDELQRAVANATAGIAPVARVLDLGAGSGVTAGAVLQRHPDARFVLLDESASMLDHVSDRVPRDRVEQVVVADLADPLPEGPFDLVISALAIHHVDGVGKRDLFGRVHTALRPSGRFVMGDVVMPADPEDAVTPLRPGFDQPDRTPDLVAWLLRHGFTPSVTWAYRDLAVITADRSG